MGRWTLQLVVLCTLGVALCDDIPEAVVKPPTLPPTTTPPQQTPSTSLTTDPLQNLLVISTLDGTLTGLDRVSGDVRWVSRDKPMIQVPQPAEQDSPDNTKLPKAPYFLPDPKTGSLYMMGKQNSLRKLPFTIPQLVAKAPCKNSEGLMYTGKKQDTWLSLDPNTGSMSDVQSDTCSSWTPTQESTCSPDNTPSFLKPVLIGKTEYTLSMMDGPRRWNVTYHHYSSLEMSPQSLQDYEQVHFTSPSEGHLMTYERSSGELLWQVELTSPVVGLYVIESHNTNLVRVPFNPIASDTLERVKGSSSSKALNPTTYVGECAYGLYAVPALVDEHVLVIGSSLPKLIEGPSAENPSIPETDFLLLGYYSSSEGSGSAPQQIGGTASPVPEEQTPFINDSKVIQTNVSPNVPQFPPQNGAQQGPSPQPTKIEIKVVFSTAVITAGVLTTVFGVLFLCYRRHKNNQLAQTQRLISIDSNGERLSGRSLSSFIDTSTGELSVGKITLYPDQVLGKGCEGTFVFKGKFEGRDVAVKRILPECFNLADREVDLLKESDQHVNVIRYFCTETDGQFRYIALELCVATLSDWVEGRWDSGGIQIQPMAVLREATEGLGYLHSLRIVHRDVKPANVLLSLGGGRVRTMISDFGLCKKIRDGRGSYSRRSGGVPGTDGWIAPEVVFGMGVEENPGAGGGRATTGSRMSYSVDIFSMGCVYYYVLTSGAHPFGDPFRRQSNIITGEHDLSLIADNPRGAHNLVRDMISTEPAERPPLRAILSHPFFWSNEKVLSFFLDVSDRIEKETEDSFPLLRKLEARAEEVVRGDWRDRICAHVAMDLRKYRTYKGDNIRDLLRALRNKKNHYRELTAEAQESLGSVPDGFVGYWVDRFPGLLEHAYVVFEGVKRDAGFARYYDPEFDWGDGEDFSVSHDYPRVESPKKLGKDFWRSKSASKNARWRGRGGGKGSSPHKRNNKEGEGPSDTPSNDDNWRKRPDAAAAMTTT